MCLFKGKSMFIMTGKLYRGFSQIARKYSMRTFEN